MNAARIRQDTFDAVKDLTPLSTRKQLVRTRMRVRQTTANRRTLPDFLVLGAQRCGTSSLYKYLGRHPQIAPSLRKEVEYFTIDYARGEAWYRAHFPLRIRKTVAAKLGKPLKTFEATPDYLFDPRAPQRTAKLLPAVKCIIVLRDPVERAQSHYHHTVRLGLEDLPFAEAIAAEDERLDRDRKALAENADDRMRNFRSFSYVSRGEYANQIAHWFEHFPRDRFHIVMTDDLFERPEETLNALLRFVDLPTWSPPEFRNYSYPSSVTSTNPDIPSDVRENLLDHFEIHDQKLEALLDVTLPWRANK